ncbi:MAG: lysostaphin resistance A-like protein [Sarcina sp.]
MLIGIVITGILTTFISSNKFAVNVVDNLKFSTIGMLLILFIAPIVEEFVFREVLFNYLRRNCSIVLAIVIQALAFAIYHGNISQGIYAFVLGIFLAIIYIYTNSLIGSITGHILANLIDLIISFKIVLLIFMIVSVICIIILIKNRKKYYNECYL